MSRSESIIQLTEMIQGALTSEFEATSIYDGILVSAGQIAADSTTLSLIQSVITDIRNEEEKHIGQLNELVKVINAQAAINIVAGEEEAEKQMLPDIDKIQ